MATSGAQSLGADGNLTTEAKAAPFPVKARNAAANVDGTRTEISCMMFTDKIFVTIVQEGRLAHWVSQSPLR